MTGVGGGGGKFRDRFASASSSNAGNGGSGYTGHYIVVCGFDPTEGEFLCRDPASHRRDLIVSAEALDAARRSFGTDEDLLLVKNAALDQRKVQAAIQAAREAGDAAAKGDGGGGEGGGGNGVCGVGGARGFGGGGGDVGVGVGVGEEGRISSSRFRLA